MRNTVPYCIMDITSTDLAKYMISLFGKDTRLQPIDLAERAGKPRTKSMAVRLSRLIRHKCGIKSRSARFGGRAGRCFFLADFKHWLEHGRTRQNVARLTPESLQQAEARANQLERQLGYAKAELERYKKLSSMVSELRKFLQLYTCDCADPCYRAARDKAAEPLSS